MIVLDTSVLIDSLTGTMRSAQQLRGAIAEGERIALPTLALYEWLRGPRTKEELSAQEALLPSAAALPFGPDEAAIAADLSRKLKRARGRDFDIAIAASAMTHGAVVWTLNRADFEDIPGLSLYRPANR